MMQLQPTFHFQRQQGVILIVAVISLLALLLVCVLAWEGNRIMINKTRLQNAVDASALMAARVYVSTQDAELAIQEAKNLLVANVSATGNQELISVDSAESLIADNGGHWQFQFLSSLNGPVVEDPAAPANPIAYFRIRLNDVTLNSFFSGLINIEEFKVTASAVAGLSPPLSSNICNLTPILVCAKSTESTSGSFYGFEPGDIQLLKIGSESDSPVGNGNYQLLDLDGSGAAHVRRAMAGDDDRCFTAPDATELSTQPGNETGPVAQGLNTRFGIYNGPVSSEDYPSDRVIVNPQDNSNNFGYGKYTVNDMTPTNPYTYHDYQQDLVACLTDSSGEKCNSSGQPQRRLLTVAVGECDGLANGATEVPLYGFGCFFLPQSVQQSGKTGAVFGEFVEGCTFGDGGFSQNPAGGDSGVESKKIILYKDPKARDA